MSGIRPLLAVIVDGGAMAAWQAQALAALGDEYQLRFYDCTNMRAQKRALRHYPYYALNLMSLRQPLTRLQRVPEGADVVPFECTHEGMWQRLPETLVERLEIERPLAIVKFGMGLLRVPAALSIPILSYHHGDPRAFRGRPAGFYELMEGRQVVGQMIQRLTDKLDAGSVLAFGETRCQPQSWGGTMRDAYRLSPLLLARALAHVRAGTHLPIEPTGKVTRLPGPGTVMRFVLQRAGASVRRAIYGAAFEKRWQVATAPLEQPATLLTDGKFPLPETWDVLPTPKGYRFLADPFFHPSRPGILAEALSAGSGLGDILHLDGRVQKRLLGGRHFSYPQPVAAEPLVLLPETASFAPPRCFRFQGDEVEAEEPLDIAGSPRLLDPTLTQHEGRFYLFGNRADEGAGVLRLWHAAQLDAPFAEHPGSPVHLSPAGARMGGPLLSIEGRLYRVGQDGRGDYGDGLLLFELLALSPERYEERLAGTVRCPHGFKGPHTLQWRDGRLLFDFYRDRFAPLAGWRRLKGRLAKR